MKTKQIYLEFDTEAGGGSAEHYYHFLIGYLMPTVLIINSLQPIHKQNRKIKFLLKSCGPLMDKVIEEMLATLHISYSFADKNITHDSFFLKVPRLEYTLANVRSSHPKIKIKLPRLLFGRIFYTSITLKKAVFTFRELIFKYILPTAPLNLTEEYTDKFLLLKRSAQHEFYNKNGKAEIPTYGSSRRAIVNLDEAASELQKLGKPVTVFEPGKYSLATQVLAFHECSGIIGIFGAEFANAIWMKPQTRIIRLIPESDKNFHNKTKGMAQILNITLIDILGDFGLFPNLNVNDIEKILK